MKGFSVGLIVSTCLIASASAQSVDDFKNAAEQKGCGLIVYQSQRYTCDDRGPKIEEYCKTRTWSCDDLDPEGLKTKIEQVTTKIEKLKSEIKSLEREISDLQSKKSSTNDDNERRSLEQQISAKEQEIKKQEEEIKKFAGMISKWEAQLTEERKEIGNRIATGTQCRDYRLDVKRAFAETKSYLERENNPEVKPYAEKIIKKITDEEVGHQKIIDVVQVGINKCERMR